jgi:hypothetical protein
MTYQEPFPPPPAGTLDRYGHPDAEWAWRTLRYWRRLGYPPLLGPPAEQVKLAREVLDLPEGVT